MASRAQARARLQALDDAVEAIEWAFGHLGEQIVGDATGLEPEIALNGLAYGFAHDTLAKDVTLAPWEVFLLLGMMRDAYRDKVLGPAECAAAAHGEEE